MKYTCFLRRDLNCIVAPLVGAWIEIIYPLFLADIHCVAPLVGAWIEIYGVYTRKDLRTVAPLVGAWIEIEWTICVRELPMSLLL